MVISSLKSSGVTALDATLFMNGFKFRIVQSLMEGIRVKSLYGVGTIIKTRGTEGVPGFSLVVQLDSWILADGQKPILYCEADDVVTINEIHGSLNDDYTRKPIQKILKDAQAFMGNVDVPTEDEGQLDEDGNRKSRRSRRHIASRNLSYASHEVPQKAPVDSEGNNKTVDEAEDSLGKVSVYIMQIVYFSNVAFSYLIRLQWRKTKSLIFQREKRVLFARLTTSCYLRESMEDQWENMKFISTRQLTPMLS